MCSLLRLFMLILLSENENNVLNYILISKMTTILNHLFLVMVTNKVIGGE